MCNQQITAYYCWIKVLIQLFFINKTGESDIGVRTYLLREAVVKGPMTSSVSFLHVKQPRRVLNPFLVLSKFLSVFFDFQNHYG